MRLAFFGDVMGRSGRTAIVERTPRLRRLLELDFVVVNGENAAGGFGVTRRVCEEMFDAGVDVVTTGNHAYDQRESLSYYETERRLLRPVNYAPNTPGRGAGLYEDANGRSILVINVICQRFMAPADDPFAAAAREIEAAPLGREADAILIDIHGETASEKMGLAQYLDGRVSVVVGSHTHIPSADAQILKGGTAYQSDAGMCGDYDSVIGMDKEEPLRRFVEKMASGRYTPATGPATLCGLFVETDDSSGLAVKAEMIRLGGVLSQTPVIDGVAVG